MITPWIFEGVTIEEIEKFVAQSEKNIHESWHNNVINNITIQSVLNLIEQTSINFKEKEVFFC